MIRYLFICVLIIFLQTVLLSQNLNDAGMSDTIVIEFDQNNTLYIPKMPTYEPGSENLTFIPFSKVQSKETIDFEISMWAIDGQILDNELIFEITNDFIIHSVKYKISRALYFNEDGSGGTWPASDEYFSEWKKLDQSDQNIYSTPAWDKIVYPVIPDGEVEKAEEEKRNNPILNYYEYTGSVIIQLKYSLKNKKFSKELNFIFAYGD